MNKDDNCQFLVGIDKKDQIYYLVRDLRGAYVKMCISKGGYEVSIKVKLRNDSDKNLLVRLVKRLYPSNLSSLATDYLQYE